jgi:hypothetical protein
MMCHTKAEHIKVTEIAAIREWEDFVVRCAIGNMKDLAQRAGIVPKSFSVSDSSDNSLRVLLREFGWDV